MTEKGRMTPEDEARARERSERDDPTRTTERQIDDNQDDMGRDANDPSQTPDENKQTGR